MIYEDQAPRPHLINVFTEHTYPNSKKTVLFSCIISIVILYHWYYMANLAPFIILTQDTVFLSSLDVRVCAPGLLGVSAGRDSTVRMPEIHPFP